MKLRKVQGIVFIVSILCVVFLITGCSETAEGPSASASLYKEGTGVVEPIEPIEKDAWLINRSMEIEGILEEQDYIELAVVDYSYAPESETEICFNVILDGEQLSDHIDAILSIITQDIDNLVMEDSYIMDVTGAYIYPQSEEAP